LAESAKSSKLFQGSSGVGDPTAKYLDFDDWSLVKLVRLKSKLPKFLCKKCGRTTKADFEPCCPPDSVCKVKSPECCGQPMIEIIDD